VLDLVFAPALLYANDYFLAGLSSVVASSSVAASSPSWARAAFFFGATFVSFYFDGLSSVAVAASSASCLDKSPIIG